MLFFVDETWQEINGREVGALAAVAIPRARYNAFCREIWQIKHNVLGASELHDAEIKGNKMFAKSAFRKREGTGVSRLLQAAEETLEAVSKYRGFAFAIWTTHEEWMLLRNPRPDDLSQIYRDLMHDFRRCMQTAAAGGGRQGLLFFDNRGFREDLAAAAAIQNFVARIGGDWRSRFMQVPHFTPSAVSPGIQAADLVAYLAAHRHDPDYRPELKEYWAIVRRIAYTHGSRKQRALRCVNRSRRAERAAKRAGRGDAS